MRHCEESLGPGVFLPGPFFIQISPEVILLPQIPSRHGAFACFATYASAVIAPGIPISWLLKEVDIRDRIKEIIDTVVPRHRRFKALEELSGLQAQTWRSIYEGRQRATEQAILALCNNWPKYAFWLGTGMTDEDHGHSSPVLERTKRDHEMLRKSGKLRLK
ncbi:hypothetical protein [Pandoraea sp. NPDC090278]|uniref:hypothetical protein n=1 Tax=Pandoraea sp. NPDC090278 TaxID=3364391 RepID=UPI00383A8C91